MAYVYDPTPFGFNCRVGRVLVRKLLLRGYKVKALVQAAGGQAAPAPLPPAVDVVTGDVGDAADCWQAVQGVDKVPCCGHGSQTLDAVPLPCSVPSSKE